MQAKEYSPFCCNYRAMFNKNVSVMSASASENLDLCSLQYTASLY